MEAAHIVQAQVDSTAAREQAFGGGIQLPLIVRELVEDASRVAYRGPSAPIDPDETLGGPD